VLLLRNLMTENLIIVRELALIKNLEIFQWMRLDVICRDFDLEGYHNDDEPTDIDTHVFQIVSATLRENMFTDLGELLLCEEEENLAEINERV
jgi:hypothetical protein